MSNRNISNPNYQSSMPPRNNQFQEQRQFDTSNLPSCSYSQPPQQPPTQAQPRSSCQFQQSPGDSCSVGSTLASPILGSAPNLGNRLNPLQQGFYQAAPRQSFDFASPSHFPSMVTARRSISGRKPKEFENMTECEDQEEMEKKLKRRQRNKEAAARCRQRRLDLMGSLQEQVDKYKNENEAKESEIRNIRQQLDRLRNFLRTHDCKMSSEEKEAHLNLHAPVVPHNMAMSIMNGHHQLKRPAPAPVITSNWMPDDKKLPRMPQRTDDLELEPDTKVPKIEEGTDKPLSALNAGGDEVLRPDHLDLGLGLRNTLPLSTPSNFALPSFSQYFPTSENGGAVPFLSETTGLTPSNQPTYTFVSTATPLETNGNELRNL